MKVQWRGQPFPDECYLRLPNGEILEGVAIVQNFCQDYLGVDPVHLHESISSVPEYKLDERIERGVLKRVCGDKTELRYRGLAIKRDKIWLQSNWDKGLLRYFYTGWSWAIADASAPVETSPTINTVLNQLNEQSEHQLNHVIGTRYRDFTYNIGFHKDKTKDIAPDSTIIVLKTGQVGRPFAFRMARTEEDPDPSFFFSTVLPPGTAVFMTTQANEIVEHGVPPWDPEVRNDIQETGSLVFRTIHCGDKSAVDGYIPWTEVSRRQAQAERNKARAKERKALHKRKKQSGASCVLCFDQNGRGVAHRSDRCPRAMVSYSFLKQGKKGLRQERVPNNALLCVQCYK